MGHFDTEYDLLLHPTLRESLRDAKLIGPSDEEENLQIYSNNLLQKFINEQLVYYPNGEKAIENYILHASKTFGTIILRNEIPIHDMPPVLQANLDLSKDKQVYEMHSNTKKLILDSIFSEIHDLPYHEILSKKDEFYESNTTNYDPVTSFVKTDVKTVESFEEQVYAIKKIKKAIN